MLPRFVRFPLVLLALEPVLIVGPTTLLSRLVGPALPRNTALELLGAVTIALFAITLYRACRRWLEAGRRDELALPGSGRELALGLAAGCALFALVTGIVALAGGIEFAGVRGAGLVWRIAAMAISSAVIEELLFRGVILRHLETLLGTWAALGLTAALFGAAHLANSNATGFAALAIAVEGGLLLGAAYLRTRRLWLAIGVHAGWNFTQGWVFSIPVSGSAAPAGLLITRLHGPVWLSGGAFGLEASVVALAVAGGAGAALLASARRRRGFVPPPWGAGRVNRA